jgi:hypothetical protein
MQRSVIAQANGGLAEPDLHALEMDHEPQVQFASRTESRVAIPMRCAFIGG